MQSPFVGCSFCGAEVTSDRKTCPHCQKPLDTPQNAALTLGEEVKALRKLADEQGKELTVLRAKLAEYEKAQESKK